MSQTYDNEMRFALFKNDKGNNDKRPDYRGTMMVAGVEYDLSAWIKTAKNGSKFMAGQIQPKRERSSNVPNQPTHSQPARAETPASGTAGSEPEENDDVPF